MAHAPARSLSADAAGGPTAPPVGDDLPPPLGAFSYTRYRSVLPPLDAEGVETTRHAVVIAGGGPVGMALALGLANHGQRCVILEADDTVCVGSRAACVSRRSLEIVERLGALPAFLAKGLPWAGGRSFYRTDEVFRFEMPNDPRQKLPPMVNLEQYYIEHYLLEAIGRCNAATPGMIDIRWGSTLERFDAFRPDGRGVRGEVAHADGRYTLHADWLVACDGGQSTVRKALDLPLVGTAYEGRYVIIDIELPSTHPTERRAWFDPPWNPGSTVLMHRQPDDLWRIDYQLQPGVRTEDALQPAAVAAFVQRHLDAIGEGHLPWKPVWTSVYRAGAMTLARYRHGRVLFAGNAAHAMPIFGVRGLNSGFDDADNLAWKLAAVAQGRAGVALLDSYSQERIAAFHVNAESAMRSTEFMSPPSRGFDLLREAALSLAGRHRGIAELINPRQTQAVAYRDSPLSSTGDELAAGPRPGEVMGEQLLEAGHLSDWIGPVFTLLCLQAEGPPPGAGPRPDGPAATPFTETWLRQVRDAVEATMFPSRIVRIGPAGAQGEFEARAASTVLDALGAGPASGGAVYLLRPDGHVAARWRHPSPRAIVDALHRAACAVCPGGGADGRADASAGAVGSVRTGAMAIDLREAS